MYQDWRYDGVQIDKKYLIIASVVLFIVGAISGWYLSGRGGNGPGTEERAATITAELAEARANNDNLAAELRRSQETINQCNATINDLGERLRNAQSGVSTATGLIEQNDSLVAEARRIAIENEQRLSNLLKANATANKQP